MSDIKRRLVATIQAHPETASYEVIMRALLAVRPSMPVLGGGDRAPARLGFLRGQIAVPEELPCLSIDDAFYGVDQD